MEATVLVIEQSPTRRERLTAALWQARGVKVVGAFAELDEALARSAEFQQFDTLLINVDRPQGVETELWAQLRSLIERDVSIVVTTKGDDPRLLQVVLGIGVAGLHPSDVQPERLVSAVRVAALGVITYDSDLTERAKISLMGPREESQIRLGGLEIDFKTRRVRRWGVPVQLSGLEFEFLACLAQAHDRVVGTAELLESVWGIALGQGGTADQVKSLVRRLRMKIEPDPKRPRYLITIRGQGYVLQDPSQGNPQT